MDTSIGNKKYFAFISYKREDEEWAIWFQHELEYYHLPALLNGREDLPKVFRPVFRDIDELRAGNLPEQIHEALASSSFLIVICSPRSANSVWVNKEIETFLEIGKEQGVNHLDRIFLFIVEGIPHDETQECFPKALRDLPAEQERIGGNVNEKGSDMAFIKVMAGMLNVDMDTLWNRYERDKAEEARKKREERDKLLIMQSRFLSEKANELVKGGKPHLSCGIAVELLPKELDNPDRPYTPEAERALRNAICHNTIILGHNGRVNSASFSPDGKRVVSTPTEDGILRVWDAESGQKLKNLTSSYIIDEYTSAAFSPDGKRIVVASRNNIVQVLDTETGEELNALMSHNDSVNSAFFSPDGKTIVSASDDGTICIWDAESGRKIKTITEYGDGISESGFSYAAFDSDGKHIVSASWDSNVRIWDVKSGKELNIFKGHAAPVRSASFSPDEKRVVSASDDGTIRIWDVETGQTLKILEGQSLSSYSFTDDDKPFISSGSGPVCFASFSPDGKRIVSASQKTVSIWDVETGEELVRLEGHSSLINTVSFSPDGKSIVSASNDKTVRIWNSETCTEVKITKEHHVVSPISPDGRSVVLASGIIWDVFTGKEIITLKGCSYLVSAAFSSDGKRLVSISEDNSVHVWDVELGLELKKLKGHVPDFTSIAFSPDGRLIVLTSVQTTQIFDYETGEELYELEGRGYHSAHFSPDGRSIVSASENIIYVWDAKTGKELNELEGHLELVNSAFFSPNGKRIVSASYDNTIRIWDVDTGKELNVLKGHNDSVSYAAFSSDGKHIISASDDKTVRIWDAETGIEIASLTGHLFYVTYANFSPDGRSVVSISFDDTIRIWPFPPLQELIDQTRERFKDRPLTPEERRMYYLE